MRVAFSRGTGVSLALLLAALVGRFAARRFGKVAATGFALENNILIVAGALDGASGLILAVLMCKAMNRSFTNVLFGAPNFVATPHLGASTVEAQDNVAFQVAERQQNMFQDFFDKMAVMAEAESQNNSHSD